MPQPLPLEQQQQIDTELYAGNKISAVKLYRQFSGSDLRDSKLAIDARVKELALANPSHFKNKSGCLGMILFFLVLSVLASATL